MNPYDRFIVIVVTLIALAFCAFVVAEFYAAAIFIQKYW